MAISSAYRLKLYNEALFLLGERRLASLSEAREPRRLLDDLWDNGIVDFCLERGQWTFATRISSLSYTPSVTPSFGYTYAFDKPTDMVRLTALTSDEYLNAPVIRYSESSSYWFCDLDTIYLKYVSNDDSYGYDTSRWPQSFFDYVASHMAVKLSPRLENSASSLEALKSERDERLKEAGALDAMNNPPKFMPSGVWVGSRGHNSRRYDRGGQ